VPRGFSTPILLNPLITTLGSGYWLFSLSQGQGFFKFGRLGPPSPFNKSTPDPFGLCLFAEEHPALFREFRTSLCSHFPSSLLTSASDRILHLRRSPFDPPRYVYEKFLVPAAPFPVTTMHPSPEPYPLPKSYSVWPIQGCPRYPRFFKSWWMEESPFP